MCLSRLQSKLLIKSIVEKFIANCRIYNNMLYYCSRCGNMFYDDGLVNPVYCEKCRNDKNKV